jgi:hypothetical protein
MLCLRGKTLEQTIYSNLDALHVRIILFFNFILMKQVKVDIMLIESDNIAKALVELIPILKISRLVLGTTESSLRYKLSKDTTITLFKKVEFAKHPLITSNAVIRI